MSRNTLIKHLTICVWKLLETSFSCTLLSIYAKFYLWENVDSINKTEPLKLGSNQGKFICCISIWITLINFFQLCRNMLTSKRILTHHICNQKNLLNGLKNKWVTMSTFNGLTMLLEGISSILLNTQFFLGCSLPILKQKNNNKKFIEILLKIWEVMDQKREFSTFCKSILLTMSRNSLTSIISEHIIHQAPLFLITWSDWDHFQSAPWPFKVENSIARTESSAVMSVHGTMPQTLPQISDNWSHKYTQFQKCTSTWTTTITVWPRTSRESITYSFPNGRIRTRISLLQKSENNCKVPMCRKTSTTGSILYLGTSKEEKLRFNIWIFSFH